MQTLLTTTRISAALAATLLCVAAAGYGSEPTAVPAAADELTLDQALAIALTQNRELAIAALDVARARERTAAARTRLLPSLSLTAQGGEILNEVHTHYAKGSPGTTPGGSPLPTKDVEVTSPKGFSAAGTATLSQPLTQLPRLRLGVKREQIGVDIAREQQREQRLALVAGVRRGYYAILQTQSAIEAGEESLKASRELERTLTRFVAQQTALRSELLVVQNRTAQQELTLLKLRNALAQQKETLNLLLGRNVQTAFRVVPISEETRPAGDVETIAVAFAESAQTLQQRALRTRPDLRRSALLIQQAETSRRIKEKEALPDVSLAVIFNQFQSNIEGLPDQVWTAGVQVTWNPFDWGKRRREVAEQERAVEQARTSLTDARERARMEVNEAARRRDEAREQMRVARSAHAAARERLRETMNRYQVKEVLLKDALEAQADLADAGRQVQDATLQWFTAQADVAKAIGEEQ